MVLCHVNKDQYSCPIPHLGGASIGGHTRHIIELLQCAVQGADNGLIDYENRHRNLSLETDSELAKKEIEIILNSVIENNKELNLIISLNVNGPELIIPSNYYREIVYNIEHTIHHLALIRVALIALGLDIVEGEFGVSSSTLKYRSQMQEYAS